MLCGLTLSTGVQAALLTPEQALHRLGSDGLSGVATRGDIMQMPVYTAVDNEGDATFYVFDKPGNGGYLLVSADDVAAPLLGYSDTGDFNADAMPAEMRWWLGEYSRQIEYARANGVAAYELTGGNERVPVAPLLKTRWNQGQPYNGQLPKINNEQCVTGCVATAVAQLMKYWNYPERGTGIATIVNPATQRAEVLNLASQSFDWSNMLDTYERGQYTEQQGSAVAYLMKAVGYACTMEYGTRESSAYAYKAGLALMNNFGYNPQMQYCTRSYYDASEWENLIYGEVSAGRPVLYGGQSTSGGHQFICDGYSSDGYFHFNWGWGGMSDGYFLLTSLNPDAIGTGGGMGGGFNYLQEATVGIQPKNENLDVANLVQYGALKVTANGLKLDVKLQGASSSASKWMNTGFSDLSMVIGAAVESVDGGTVRYIDITKATVKKPELIQDEEGLGMGFYGIDGKGSISVPSNLPDGKYKAVIVTKQQSGGEWKPVLTLPEYYNFFYFTKSGSKITSVEVFSDASVTIDEVELLSPLYYNCLVKMRVKVTNNSEKEMTKGFYPDLFKNGVIQMMGDGVMLSIPPKSTVTKEFITEFRRLNNASVPTGSTPYVLKMKDPDDDTYYSTTRSVTMELSSGTADFSITDFVVPGAPTVSEKVGERLVEVYQVEGNELELNLKVTNYGNYFGYPVDVVIADTKLHTMTQSQFGPVCVLEANQSAELTATLDLSWLQTNVPYIAVVFCNSVQQDAWIYFKMVDGASVGEITVDEAPVKYYNMQGIEVVNPEKGMLLIRKQGAKTEKIIF